MGMYKTRSNLQRYFDFKIHNSGCPVTGSLRASIIAPFSLFCFHYSCHYWQSIWLSGSHAASRLCFYQTRSAWSMDQGSTKKRSAVHNFVPTVTKFCVMWEGLSLPLDTKFGNCRGEIVDRRMVFIWSLIHGSGWSRLIKAEPGCQECKLSQGWT